MSNSSRTHIILTLARRQLYGAVALFVFMAEQVTAADMELKAPFMTSNLNPMVQVYGVPTTRDATLAKPAQWKTAVLMEAANNSSGSSSEHESISLDGETYRATLSAVFGFTDNIELGVELPYLSHDGGQLDSLIEDWHQLWNLPNGNRDDLPRDRLDYSYFRQNEALVNVHQSQSGIGDISLLAAYRLDSTANTDWALRSAIELPTGAADQLTGSESTDVSLGLYVSSRELFDLPSLAGHANAGVLWINGGEVAENIREDWAGYGSTSLSWMVRPRLSLKAQLDFHSAIYDSSREEIGEFAAQLIFGGSFRANKNTLVDISISEDIVVDTSPDVVFQLGIRSQF